MILVGCRSNDVPARQVPDVSNPYTSAGTVPIHGFIVSRGGDD
jgi:hypothetical protein